MAISIELAPELEQQIRDAGPELTRAAKEALLIQAFRTGVISHCQLAGELGLDRFEANTLLQSRGVTEGTLTHADLDTQRRILDEVLGPVR